MKTEPVEKLITPRENLKSEPDQLDSILEKSDSEKEKDIMLVPHVTIKLNPDEIK